MDTDATTLWKAFQEEGDETARAALVDQHMPLVHHIARQVQQRVGRYVALEDLVNAGCLGLLAAVDSFDASRGLAFSTHAVPRIRGAILDDIRRADHASRAVRQRQRGIAIAERQLASQKGRKPRDEETAEHMEIGVDTLWKWKADAKEVSHLSLDKPVANADGPGPTIGEMVADTRGAGIEDRITTQEELGVLEREIRALPERERTVLMLYYHEELKLREIAEILGLTESRISQIRTKALQTLRSRMGRLREGE